MVESSLNLKNFPEVFVLGDQAACADKRFGFLPMLAQVATEQGKFVGKNIARLMAGKPLKEFHYRHKGNLISFGKWKARAHIGNTFVRFGGPAAWLIWRFNYLTKMPGTAKKFRLFFDWILYLFSRRDIAEI
jgi:NADH dehydrogenase